MLKSKLGLYGIRLQNFQNCCLLHNSDFTVHKDEGMLMEIGENGNRKGGVI